MSYFVASKVFGFLVTPSNVLFSGVIIGTLLCLTQYRRTGRAVLGLSIVFIGLFSVVPVGEMLIRKLESRFPVPVDLPPKVGGVIVLGGTINPALSRASGQLNINGNGERLLFFKHLSEKYPTAPLIFTGGSGDLFNPEDREGDFLWKFANIVGLDMSRVIVENRSRNTMENARESKKLAPDLNGNGWILVTSARHMPRAVGIFRKQGWKVIPYPVDFTVTPVADFGLRFRILGGLASVDAGFREFVGLLAAAVFGHSDAIFPMPDD